MLKRLSSLSIFARMVASVSVGLRDLQTVNSTRATNRWISATFELPDDLTEATVGFVQPSAGAIRG